MKKKVLSVLLIISLSTLCASCSLLPQEEVYSKAPVIKPYEKEEYELTQVQRGDLISEKKITCTYTQTGKEKLSFSVSGEYIDSIYVSEGQQVAAGDLLAELELDDLKKQIAAKEYDVEVLEMKRNHVQENLTLEMYRQDAVLEEAWQRWEPETEEESEEPRILTPAQEKEHAQKKLDYAKQMQEIEDELYIQKLELAEMKEELAERQIYAGMSGTVTYVRTVVDGMRSSAGENIAIITDFDTSVFAVKGNDAQYFQTGDLVTLECSKKEHEAEVIEKIESEIDEDDMIAYLSLKQPDPTLESGNKGSIIVTLDSRSDVLYLDEDAVKTANGQPFVHVLDKEGMRVMKNVSTGLVCDGYVEITEGLEEGDSVILE